jgi:hypothetical protein
MKKRGPPVKMDIYNEWMTMEYLKFIKVNRMKSGTSREK